MRFAPKKKCSPNVRCGMGKSERRTMATTKMTPVSGEKLNLVFAKRGLTKTEVSERLGYADSYLATASSRGEMSTAAAVALEAIYEIKPDEYAPKAEQKPQPKPDAKCDAPPLRGIVAKADGSFMMGTLYLDGKEILKGFSVIRSDIDDPTLRYAQAVSYLAHVIFKEIQRKVAVENGEPMAYQFKKK